MSEFEKWFKTTEAYRMLEEQNYFKMDLFFFVGARNQYRHSGVQVAYLTWQHQQSKIDELQKRVDAAKQLIEDLNKCYQQDHQNKFEYWRGFADSAGILGKRLEQALKGGNE